MLQHHGPGFRWFICPWSLIGRQLPGNNEKNIFIYYLLEVQLFSKSNVNTDCKTNIISRSNHGILNYIELNNILQETNLEGVHMTGAAMTIGCGILYMISQTALSYKMDDTLSLSRLRLIMAVVCSLTAASCILVNHRDKICFNRQIDKNITSTSFDQCSQSFWSVTEMSLTFTL